MPTVTKTFYHKLETLAAEELLTAGRIVHFTQRTNPHILCCDRSSFHSISVDRYSHKSPEAVVFYFNVDHEQSLPKTIQKEWGVTKKHRSTEVKIIVAANEAEQLVKLVPKIIDLLEELDYEGIRALLPFDLYTHPDYPYRICTVAAKDLLG
ncbi:hypothetical protein SAMN02745181_3597 [Rubritalea squalenifaciens DSM 18772]|uniref:Uncharacterized protein n=1 Tax=Rubritalea squalenifaciens DSM 18772 TaxID=1123071 RepID=A0A1M6RBU4_9BACT|nr:hypothetical protein [Rubritalea squalenifaciens]SHK29818.1 hypothetical protein SAMN02745181_3597 [Rubritalea squalenifaciens DSM 18772]